MQIEILLPDDIDLVVPLYVDYYNNYEDGCWTEATAKKRIGQVLSTEAS